MSREKNSGTCWCPDGQDCEQDRAAAREYLRQLVTLSRCRNSQLTRVAPSGRSYPEARAYAADDDPVVFSPGTSAQRVVGNQQPGSAAIERRRPQLAAHFEPDRLAIMREEHVASSCAAGDGLRIQAVEITPKEQVLAAVIARKNHAAARWRHGEVDARLGQVGPVDDER